MALSDSTYTNFTNNGAFRLVTDWSATQNVAGNYSDVTAQVFIQSLQSWAAVSDGTTSLTSITINGDRKEFQAYSTCAAWEKKLLGSHTVRVPHKSDGSKQIAIYSSHNFDISWNGAWVGTVYCETWPWLNTITRASTIWLSNTSGTPLTTNNYGDTLRINITKSYPDYKHTVSVNINDHPQIIMDKGTASTVDWVVPLSYMNEIPNETSRWGRVAVDTWTVDNVFVGGTEIWWQSFVPDTVKPSVGSLTITDSVSAIATLMGAGKYVQNASIPSATMNSVTTAYSSPIVLYEFLFEGKYYQGASPTTLFDKPTTFGATQAVSCSVKDARGRWSAAVQTTINVIAYSPPTIISFSAARLASPNTTVNALRKGTVAPLFNGTINKNTTNVKVEYRIGGTTGAFTLGNNTVVTSNFDASVQIGTAFSAASVYEIRLTVTDSISPAVTSTVTVGTVVKPFSIGPTGIGAGKIWTQGGLDVGGGAFVDGGLTLTGSTAGNVPRTAYANGYHGLILPDGTDGTWLRTPTTGLLPAASGGASSSLGTSSWPFNNIYGKTVYQDGSKIVDEGTIANSGTNWDRNYIKFANGSMVVWGNTYVASVAFSNGPSGLYWSSSGITATFGVTFTALHSVVGTGSACFLQHSGTSMTSVTYNCYRMWNDTVTVGAQWVAWGRWK